MTSLIKIALAVLVLALALIAALPSMAQSGTALVYLPMITDGKVAGATAPTPIAATGDELAMRREVIRLVNVYRVANGCPAATEDAALMNGSQAWSEYMVANNYFEHSSTVDAYWYYNHGYPRTKFDAAENIGTGYETAQQVFAAWQNSPNHNRTMLACYFYLEGSSYAYNIGVGLRGRRWTLAISEYYSPSAPTPTPRP